MWVSDGGGRAGCNGGRRFEVLQDLLAQLLQPSFAFCFSLQPMRRTDQDWTVRRHWLQAKKNANEGCNSCATGV